MAYKIASYAVLICICIFLYAKILEKNAEINDLKSINMSQQETINLLEYDRDLEKKRVSNIVNDLNLLHTKDIVIKEVQVDNVVIHEIDKNVGVAKLLSEIGKLK